MSARITTVRGTEVTAIAYSLVESGDLAGIDLRGYITVAVQGIEMGDPPEELLPLRELWAQAEK